MNKSLLSWVFDAKRRWISLLMIVGASSLFIVIPWRLAALLVMVIVSVYLLYASMKKDEEKAQLKRRYEQQFLLIFRYFQILLQQSLTAYQALKTLLAYVEDPLHHELALFLVHMDQDKSIAPYRQFASTFDSMMVEQILLSMYQLDLQGGDGMSLFHFQYLFDQIDRQTQEEAMRQFHDKLQQSTSLVMVGTGLLAFLFLIGVIDLMVGLLYGA